MKIEKLKIVSMIGCVIIAASIAKMMLPLGNSVPMA